MKKSELNQLLTELTDDMEVDEIIDSNFINIDKFKTLIDKNKDFKSFMDSEKDKHSSKAIKTALDNFKAKEMRDLIDKEVQERTGEKPLTKEQQELKELKAQFESMKREKLHAEKLNKYNAILNEKNIPSTMVKFLLDIESDEKTEENIKLFEEGMSKYIDAKVDGRIKNTSYTPPANDKKTGKISFKDVVENPSLLAQYKEQHGK